MILAQLNSGQQVIGSEDRVMGSGVQAQCSAVIDISPAQGSGRKTDYAKQSQFAGRLSGRQRVDTQNKANLPGGQMSYNRRVGKGL